MPEKMNMPSITVSCLITSKSNNPPHTCKTSPLQSLPIDLNQRLHVVFADKEHQYLSCLFKCCMVHKLIGIAVEVKLLLLRQMLACGLVTANQY